MVLCKLIDGLRLVMKGKLINFHNHLEMKNWVDYKKFVFSENFLEKKTNYISNTCGTFKAMTCLA